VAVPVTVLSNVEVAVTVNVVSATASSLTVTPPKLSMTAGASADKDQVTVCGAKFAVTTVAVKAKDCPADTVAVAGDKVMDVTEGVPGTNTAAFANGDTEKIFHT
jgi:hypothetical protein